MAESLKQSLQKSIDYQNGKYSLGTNEMWQVISALSDQEAYAKHKEKTKRVIRSLLKKIDPGSRQEENALQAILAAEKFIKEQCK